MRKSTIYFTLILLLCPLMLVAQTAFYQFLTKDISADMVKIQDDYRTDKGINVLLKDLQELDHHLQMENAVSSNDIYQINLLTHCEEYHDLRMACQYAMAAIYLQQGDSLKTKDAFSTAITYSNPFIGKRTPLQQLIGLTQIYRKAFPHPEANEPLSSEMMGTSLIKDVLDMRFNLRLLSENPVEPSNCPLANRLLGYALPHFFPSWKMLPLAFTTRQTAIIIQKMAATSDQHIALWTKSQYALQFVVDAIEEDRLSDIINPQFGENCLFELALHGFGPANFILGVRCEKRKTQTKEIAELAYQFYEQASMQNYNTGTIRLAHCLAFGYGCPADEKRAFTMLKQLKGDMNFPRYGAYAYAQLLEKGMGGKINVKELMECYTQAASTTFLEQESKVAQDRIAKLYEKYYQ